MTLRWRATTTAVPPTTSTTVPTITVPSTIPPPSDGPPPLPPMTIIDGRLYQDGGIPLPPYYLG